MKEKLRNLIGSMNRAFIARRKSVLKKSQSYGLYVGQPQVLAFVRQNPGCTQTEIAEHLGVSSASIAFSTKRLQKAGYLMKQVNHLNMRCNKLYVTHEGEEVLDRFKDVYDEMNLAMFEGFTDEELEQLRSFTERVNKNMEKMISEE
ncbi:MAG: winged helix-turn-helix transcriptional regulator [Flexilinea sp.]|nr:winged helix-turn-helix transcriptional regulator [Flexilinea sp.]